MSDGYGDDGFYADVDATWQGLEPGYDGQVADYLPDYGEQGPADDAYLPEQATWDASNYDGYAPAEAWETAAE